MVKNSLPQRRPLTPFNPDLVALSPQGKIAWALRYEPQVESTQDLARRAASAGAAEGWTIVTDWQQAGRGRVGRPWLASPGLDLLFSCVLRPPASLLSLLPLLSGLAIAQGIRLETGLAVDLKWPNDLLIDQRKLAGILLERGGKDEVVLGVGVNVNSTVAALPPLATSAALQLGRAVSRERLLAAILDSIDRASARVTREGNRWIVPAWRQESSMLGRRVSYVQHGTTRIATAVDIEADGALTVRLEDGTREHLYAGEVQLVRPQS